MVAFGLFSFTLIDKQTFDFTYPKRKGCDVSLSANHFKKLSKERRGTDYCRLAEGDGFICAVLYYKLNAGEQKELVDAPKTAMNRPEKSPAYPYAYFKNRSNPKETERNDSAWGSPSDPFMFRQNDVIVEGTPFLQKHMYGYALVDKGLFVNVHLSKTMCTPADSTEMREMLRSLAFKN